MDSNLPPYSSHLLPDNASPLERIFASVVNDRITAIPVPIKTLNDPYNAPAAFLDHLAFEVGVDIWNEDWTELKKRSVIATTIRTKSILGTVAGISAYIGIEDGRLIDVVVPPQTPFISGSLTPDQFSAWLGELPQLRIYYGNEFSSVIKGQSFVGSSYISEATLTADNGRQLLGRHAFIYDPKTGLETQIRIEDINVVLTRGAESISERVYVPGAAYAKQAFIGTAFVGADYITNSAKGATIVSYTLNQDPTQDIGSLILALGEALTPVNSKYDRISVTGTKEYGAAFIGSSTVGNCFVFASLAETNFYDRLYIADSTVDTPSTAGTTYIGHSRLQMEPYRAEMLIDAQETTPGAAMISRFIGNCYVQAQDDTKRNRILQAIELSKAGRDRVFVDFRATNILSFSDNPILDGSFVFGQRLPRVRL